MKTPPNKKRFLFIKPPDHNKRIEHVGIYFLRGFLQDKEHQTEFLNFHKILRKNKNFTKGELDKPLNSYIKKLLDKQKINLNNIDAAGFYGLFFHYFYEKIWPAAYELEKEEKKVFCSNLSKFEKTDYVGISIGSSYQFLFSLSLCDYIKNNCKNSPEVILGGSFVTRDYSNLIRLLEKNPIVDYLVVGEGEFPLHFLAEKKEKSKIPGLIYLKNKKYVYSKNLTHSEDINEFSPPFFEKENKIKFLRATNKCYWGRCAFCSLGDEKNRAKTASNIRQAELVIKDIKKNINAKSMKDNRFVFCDAALPVNFVKNLSEELIKDKGLKIKFAGYMRFEKNIDYAFLAKAKRAGLETIGFGMETSSKRLLKLIEKGIDVDTSLKIIDMCSKLNIKIVLSFIICLPTQTKKELREDLIFIKNLSKKYKNIIFSIIPFFLDRQSKIFLFPEKYGLRINKIPGRGISGLIDEKNISREEAAEIASDVFKKTTKNIKIHWKM